MRFLKRPLPLFWWNWMLHCVYLAILIDIQIRNDHICYINNIPHLFCQQIFLDNNLVPFLFLETGFIDGDFDNHSFLYLNLCHILYLNFYYFCLIYILPLFCSIEFMRLLMLILHGLIVATFSCVAIMSLLTHH